MTILAHVERERAIGMLKANVTPLVVAKRFRCHVRTIGRLKNRFQQIRTTSHRPRPGRRCVPTRRQYRDIQTYYYCNRFHLGSVTARTSQGTHNQKNQGSNCEKSFQEICLKNPPLNVLMELYFGAVFTSN